MTPPPAIRLTSLAHGGGCGCKLAPDMLRSLLADQAATGPFERLLVGNETADDAAVWALEDGTCVIATTDFFMPMVDDPYEFGRIAAANAISDVYATGGTPIMALAILGMPVGKIEPEVVSRILAGGAAICAEAGIPVAGGHSIDNPEPVYGLAVIGTARREHIRRNADARAGDVLILTKPIGVGIYSAAFKRDALSPEAYREFIATTTQLNKVGAILARDPDVHMLTDVTGFGLLGHGLEVARGANVTVVIEWDAVPLLKEAEELAKADFVTGASHRNWASYGDHVRLPEDVSPWQRHLLSDPQTSGGLLIACAPEREGPILNQLASEGFRSAARIGRVRTGRPEIHVET